MKIVLTGGTGFIGETLVLRMLEAGHSVVLLTRRLPAGGRRRDGDVRYIEWDGRNVGAWASEVDGADAVLNLVGEPIAGKRWTAGQKDRILRSRIDATQAVVSAVSRAKTRPFVLVNASGVGYYGAVDVGEVTEAHPRGEGFLAETCERWENEAQSAETLGVRVAMLRLGVVLDKGGGALQKMVPPFRFFVGGPIGPGHQWFPWIHREDVAGIILHILSNPSLAGPINLAAPQTVTMKQFCSGLGKALGRPSWAPVPAFVLKLMLGEMAEMLLTGQRVIPKKVTDSRYVFRFPNLDGALRSIFP